VLTNTAAVRNLIKEQKEAQLHSVMQTSAAQQMMTFEQHRQELVNSGLLLQ
jgi:twitching motility protein PilT